MPTPGAATGDGTRVGIYFETLTTSALGGMDVDVLKFITLQTLEWSGVDFQASGAPSSI